MSRDFILYLDFYTDLPVSSHTFRAAGSALRFIIYTRTVPLFSPIHPLSTMGLWQWLTSWFYDPDEPTYPGPSQSPPPRTPVYPQPPRKTLFQQQQEDRLKAQLRQQESRLQLESQRRNLAVNYRVSLLGDSGSSSCIDGFTSSR